MSEQTKKSRVSLAEKTQLLLRDPPLQKVSRAVLAPIATGATGIYVSQEILGFVLAQSIMIALLLVASYLIAWCIWEVRRAEKDRSERGREIDTMQEELEHARSRIYSLESLHSRRHRGLLYGFHSLSDRELPPQSFELYLSYRELSVRHLGELLRAIDGLHKVVFGLLIRGTDSGEWESSGWGAHPVYDFLGAVEDGLRGSPDERLLVGACHTGDSIKLVAVPGWLPRFRLSEEGDLEVGVPKRGSSILLTGYLLSAIVSHGASTLNDATSALKNHREIDKIELEIEKLELELERVPKEICIHADGVVQDVRAQTVGHTDNDFLTVKTSRDWR